MNNTNDPAVLRERIRDLEQENRELRAQIDGDFPTATRWLQHKVWRQAAALDRLNRRVLTQRFVLRTIENLGRGLTDDEWRAARDAVANEQTRDRIALPTAA